MDISLPTSISASSIGFLNHQFNLSPQGRAIDLESFYNLPQYSNGKLQLGCIFRFNVGSEAIALINYQENF